MIYLSPFALVNPRRALGQLLGWPHRGVHEVPVDHLPPLPDTTVTSLVERRRERQIIGLHGTRSG